MATAEKLLTADEYFLQPDAGQPTELIRGKIVPVSTPDARHGPICSRIVHFVGNHVGQRQLGHMVSDGAGLITERDPDTVRRMDVAFFSDRQIPSGPPREGPLAVAPKLVFNVLSAADRWREVLAKVAAFLNAGAEVVCVLDPGTQTAHVFDADLPARALGLGEDLAFPEILGDWRVPVYRFFDVPPPLEEPRRNRSHEYQYLEYRVGDSIRQPFVIGRKIWAEVLYRETVGLEPRTPEEVATDFEVPLGAVVEAIRYCQENEVFLREERAREDARLREYEQKYPPLLPPDDKPES